MGKGKIFYTEAAHQAEVNKAVSKATANNTTNNIKIAAGSGLGGIIVGGVMTYVFCKSKNKDIIETTTKANAELKEDLRTVSAGFIELQGSYNKVCEEADIAKPHLPLAEVAYALCIKHMSPVTIQGCISTNGENTSDKK